jgi:16S rRNA (guanine527-N7)-methyltransferase
MRLTYVDRYSRWGLDARAFDRLATLGDLLLSAAFNVTGIREAGEIERIHFLDSLSLLDLPILVSAQLVVDIGSGAGLPALVLATALPDTSITALESQRKKCHFIAETAGVLGLGNVRVCCERAEEHARGDWRETYDVAVSRAVGSLPVVAEYSLPLVRTGGHMVAMKGSISDQERIQAEAALDILGAGSLQAVKMDPFPGAENRWVYLAQKRVPTPDFFPRRAGVPSKRPLGRIHSW